VAGCLTRTVADTAVWLDVVSGPSERDPNAISALREPLSVAAGRRPEPLRVAVSFASPTLAPVTDEVRRAVEDTATALLGLGHAVGRRDPVSLLCYGFLFAALFWAAVQPVWRFPAGRLDDSVSLLGHLERFSLPVWLLLLYVVVAGTMITFLLVATALRHIPATRVGIVAMLEPVAASAVAFVWLGESFGAAQLVGGAIVLTGILLAQTAR